MMHYYTDVLTKYFDFSGRARRAEYWMFDLCQLVAIFAIAFVDALLKTGGILTILYVVATVIPALGVTVRRLHDTGRSGWWLLISFIPFASLVLLAFELMDSQPGPNQYGPNPKGVPAFQSSAHERNDGAGDLEELMALKARGELLDDEFVRRNNALLR